MSLIVLKSQRTLQNADGSTTILSGSSPAEFQCDFRETIKLEDGQQIQLVSCTFHKDPAFVVDGANDTLVWRIGGTGAYDDHEVVLGHGSYSGLALAAELQRSLEASTVIDVFKGAWIVTFERKGSTTASSDHAVFTIVYSEQDVPAADNLDLVTVSTLAGTRGSQARDLVVTSVGGSKVVTPALTGGGDTIVYTDGFGSLPNSSVSPHPPHAGSSRTSAQSRRRCARSRRSQPWTLPPSSAGSSTTAP